MQTCQKNFVENCMRMKEFRREGVHTRFASALPFELANYRLPASLQKGLLSPGHIEVSINTTFLKKDGSRVIAF